MIRFLILTFLSLSLFSCTISDLPDDNGSSSRDRSRDDSNPPRDPSDNPSDPRVNINKNEKEIFDRINNYRASQGLRRLQWIDQAIIEAQDHSVNMARVNLLSHTGFSLRVRNIGNRENVNILSSAENVGYNTTAERMVNGWRSSFGHHRNILGNFTHTGIGEAKGVGSRLFYTQIFLRIAD